MNWIERRLLELAFRVNQVGEHDCIILVEGTEQCDEFVDTIVEALQVVETTDPRRYARIKERIKWIVNQPLYRSGGRYECETQACLIDFHHTGCGWERKWAVGWCASLLVHEATHGVIDGRGIPYTRRLRTRIERCCVREEQRFLARLAKTEPEVATWLTAEFDESGWAPYWNANRTAVREWNRTQLVDLITRAWPEACRAFAQMILGSRVSGRDVNDKPA